jgi:hypothetical protein
VGALAKNGDGTAPKRGLGDDVPGEGEVALGVGGDRGPDGEVIGVAGEEDVFTDKVIGPPVSLALAMFLVISLKRSWISDILS